MAFEVKTSFEYPYDINQVLLPWRDKLGAAEYDDVVTRLLERDRALEDKLNIAPGFDQVDAEESTASTTDTDLATVGPEVAIKVPRSGAVIVTGGAFTTVTADGATAFMSMYIDGALHGDWVLLGNNTGGSLSASLSSTFIIRDLVPGRHTFRFKYATSNGAVTVRFAGRFMLVEPIA